METILMLFFGFVTGIKHSVETDHIAAVSTIVTRSKKISSAVFAGSWWGVGHTLTLLLLGFIVLMFGITIPERAGIGLELFVGVMLIILGIINIKTGIIRQIHIHRHSHQSPAHIHIHYHNDGDNPHEHLHHHKSFNRIKSLIIGVVHGIAGSAVLTLLVLSTIKSIPLGLLYIALFGMGTVAGMTLFSLILGLPISLVSRRYKNFQRLSVIFSGALSVVIGILLVNTTIFELLY